jgi:hypothetical protein
MIKYIQQQRYYVEVISVELRLVGGITDEEELTELESITKVFVIARRIQNLPYERVKKEVAQKSYLHPLKKITIPHTYYNHVHPVLSVRGFT